MWFKLKSLYKFSKFKVFKAYVNFISFILLLAIAILILPVEREEESGFVSIWVKLLYDNWFCLFL